MYAEPIAVFVHVVDCKSFSKAAQKLYLSPVAVMKRVNTFEEQVGAKLLNRTPSGVTLTAAGKVVYDAGKEILPIIYEAFQRAREVAETEMGSVKIGNSRLHPLWLLKERLAELGGAPLPVNLEIVPFYEEYLDLPTKLSLLGRDFDCMISPYDASLWGDSFSVFHLKSFPIRITLPAGHPLAAKERLTADDLHGQALLLPQRGRYSAFDELRDRLQAGHPQIKFTEYSVYNTEVLNQCLRGNYLMATFDNWFTQHPLLCTLPVDWNAEIPMGLLYSKHPSKETQRLIAYLKQESA